MVNLLAVLVAAIASMVIGSIWYGPLFGKLFMRLKGMEKLTKKEQDAMKKKMVFMYALQFAASFAMFYVLAWFIGALDQRSLLGGMHIALLIWAGFIVPLKLGEEIWGGKMQMFWLGIGHMLITMLAAGAIIGAWG